MRSEVLMFLVFVWVVDDEGLTEFCNQLNDDTLTGDRPSHLKRQIIVQHLTVELGLEPLWKMTHRMNDSRN